MSRIMKDVQMTAKVSTVGKQTGQKQTAPHNIAAADLQHRILTNHILNTAEVRAAALISAAHGKSRCILEEAEAEAEAIKEQVQAEAFAQGYRAGEQEALRLKEEAKALLEQAQRERETIINSAEPELVTLALRLAEKIVNRQLDLDPSLLVAMLKGIRIEDLTKEVVLRVNPEQLPDIKARDSELRCIFSQEGFSIEADPTVEQGFILETEAGIVDARVATQVKELEVLLKEVMNRG